MEAEKKQKSNEKSYKSGPRNEKWEMDIKSDHNFDEDVEKQTFLRREKINF